MKNRKKKITILWIVSLLPALITAIAMQFMENSVPMHYDISGNIDRWGSKYENFVFPVMIVLFTLFWCGMLRYFKNKQSGNTNDKKRAEAANNEKIIYITALAMSIMFGVLDLITLYMAYSAAARDLSAASIDFSAAVNILMGIFIIVIANFLPKAKRNSAAGIRTVWSMDNDQTWAASNRFGGIVFMASGILIIIESLIIGGFVSTMIMLAIIIAAAIICMAYSYYAYKKYQTK